MFFVVVHIKSRVCACAQSIGAAARESLRQDQNINFCDPKPGLRVHACTPRYSRFVVLTVSEDRFSMCSRAYACAPKAWPPLSSPAPHACGCANRFCTLMLHLAKYKIHLWMAAPRGLLLACVCMHARGRYMRYCVCSLQD
jgi:hypothetical protein